MEREMQRMYVHVITQFHEALLRLEPAQQLSLCTMLLEALKTQTGGEQPFVRFLHATSVV